LLLGVVWAQVLLVGILECEVQGLSWEVSENIGQVSSPVGKESLFLVDSIEAISNALVSIFNSDVL
jgi:hypothetical protein